MFLGAKHIINTVFKNASVCDIKVKKKKPMAPPEPRDDKKYGPKLMSLEQILLEPVSEDRLKWSVINKKLLYNQTVLVWIPWEYLLTSNFGGQWFLKLKSMENGGLTRLASVYKIEKELVSVLSDFAVKNGLASEVFQYYFDRKRDLLNINLLVFFLGCVEKKVSVNDAIVTICTDDKIWVVPGYVNNTKFLIDTQLNCACGLKAAIEHGWILLELSVPALRCLLFRYEQSYGPSKELRLLSGIPRYCLSEIIRNIIFSDVLIIINITE